MITYFDGVLLNFGEAFLGVLHTLRDPVANKAHCVLASVDRGGQTGGRAEEGQAMRRGLGVWETKQVHDKRELQRLKTLIHVAVHPSHLPLAITICEVYRINRLSESSALDVYRRDRNSYPHKDMSNVLYDYLQFTFASVIRTTSAISTVMGFNFPLFTVPIATILCYVPHVARVILAKQANAYDNKDPRNSDTAGTLSAQQAMLQKRLLGAHQNQLETIALYAAAVVANIARKPQDSWVLNLLTALYITFRAVYIAVYASPPFLGGYLRSIVFAACFSIIFALWVRAFT